MANKVLVTDGMAENGVAILKGNSNVELDLRKGVSAEDLGKIIGDYECIVIRSATTLTKDLIEKANKMKLIVRAGAGVDNIDVPTATAKKIPVMNTASANSLAAAEQTIALMFSMLRQIPQAAASLTAGRWDRKAYVGFEATGKTLGVVGLGNIGRLVAEKALGLGMNVIAYDPNITDVSRFPNLNKYSESMTVVRTVAEVASKCDILSVHVPKVKETTNLVNADLISKMKKGSWVINCARGGIVDEKAVVSALESGQLTGAAFDVFEKEPPEFSNPILKHPKVVCVPHLGASTQEAQVRVASTAASQIIGFFEKGDRAGVIN